MLEFDLDLEKETLAETPALPTVPSPEPLSALLPVSRAAVKIVLVLPQNPQKAQEVDTESLLGFTSATALNRTRHISGGCSSMA
jgi:hypothetical protein